MTVHVLVCNMCVCVLCPVSSSAPGFYHSQLLSMTSHYSGWLPAEPAPFSKSFFFSSLSVYRCPFACNSIPPLLYLFIPASVCISTVRRVSTTIMSYPVRSARSLLLFFLLASPSFNTFLSFSFNVSICAGAPPRSRCRLF